MKHLNIMDYSRTETNFLNVRVFKNEENKQLETVLCSKPTDKYHHLYATSCRCIIFKKSLPNGQD